MMVMFSTMLYALGKELGLENANLEWQRQVAEPDVNSLPAARMFSRVKAACTAELGSAAKLVLAAAQREPVAVDLGIWVDCAATHIGKARSRAFFAAVKANADLWYSCDDDVEASQSTVTNMLIAADTPTPRIVFLPCWLREREVASVAFSKGARSRFGLAAIDSAATTAFVVNRAALRLLAEAFGHLRYLDDDGVHRLALFHETLIPETPETAGKWWGEDLSFCHRAALAGVELVAVMAGMSRHGDKMLKLDDLARTLEVQ